MAQAVWTGFVGFGLVNVPVALYSATAEEKVSFNQLRRGTDHRVRYRKVDEVTGEELTGADIVRGFPVGRGRYVVVDDDELRQIAPGRSSEITIIDFVDLAEVDPVCFQKSYWLAPRTAQAEKAYALLREAMRRQNRIGIATMVMRDREYLVAVRVAGDALALETLHFADEIRPAAGVLGPGVGADLPERELAMAEQLVSSLAARFEHERYRPAYRERVLALIEAKRSGVEYALEEAEPQENIVDLAAALEASITRARAERAASAPAERAAPGARPVAGPAEQQSFAGMSRSELLALAAEREVPGRARMSKLQLVEALSAGEEPLTAAKARRSAS